MGETHAELNAAVHEKCGGYLAFVTSGVGNGQRRVRFVKSQYRFFTVLYFFSLCILSTRIYSTRAPFSRLDTRNLKTFFRPLTSSGEMCPCKLRANTHNQATVWVEISTHDCDVCDVVAEPPHSKRPVRKCSGLCTLHSISDVAVSPDGCAVDTTNPYSKSKKHSVYKVLSRSNTALKRNTMRQKSPVRTWYFPRYVSPKMIKRHKPIAKPIAKPIDKLIDKLIDKHMNNEEF